MKLLILIFLSLKALDVTAQVLDVTAQYSKASCSNILRSLLFPPAPAGSGDEINPKDNLLDDFFDAIREVESNGDLCKVSADGVKLGSYQISEEYYKEAVEFDERLKTGGN